METDDERRALLHAMRSALPPYVRAEPRRPTPPPDIEDAGDLWYCEDWVTVWWPTPVGLPARLPEDVWRRVVVDWLPAADRRRLRATARAFANIAARAADWQPTVPLVFAQWCQYGRCFATRQPLPLAVRFDARGGFCVLQTTPTDRSLEAQHWADWLTNANA